MPAFWPYALSAACLCSAARGWGFSKSKCGFLKAVDVAATATSKFCSSGVGETLKDAEIKESKKTAYKVATKAQKAYNDVCDLSPVVADIWNLVKDGSGCTSTSAAVFALCAETGDAPSDIGKSGKGWEKQLAKMLGKAKTTTKDVYSTSSAKIVQETVTPSPVPMKISGSKGWWSCSHANMHTCGDLCCCDAGFEYSSGSEACMPGSPPEPCAMGVLHTASNESVLDDLLQGFIESKASMEVYAKKDITYDEWPALEKSLGAACPNGHPFHVYHLYDDDATDEQKICFVNIAMTERWTVDGSRRISAQSLAVLACSVLLSVQQFMH